MVSGVVYMLRIFKMFHGLMNNPVRTERGCHTLRHKLSFTTYDRGRASVATTVSIRPRIQKTDRTKHEALPHP